MPRDDALETRLAQLTLQPGTAACVWLGQGGYLVKSAAGLTVAVDPYCSDWAETGWGVKRLRPTVIDPERFAPDLVLATHGHEDHLDRPTLVGWAKKPGIRFGGPSSCVGRVRAWGWPRERTITINRGETVQVEDVVVTATFARHEVPGALTEDAVGFLLDFPGVRLWVVGDSEYDTRLRPTGEARIDVMFVPINGVGGNMNAHEAALLAWRVRPRSAVPMHYGMWADEGYGPGATLDPELFRETLGRLGGGIEAPEWKPGAIAIIDAAASGPAP